MLLTIGHVLALLLVALMGVVYVISSIGCFIPVFDGEYDFDKGVAHWLTVNFIFFFIALFCMALVRWAWPI